MSMISWTENGFGFPLFNGKNIEPLARFVVQNSDYGYGEEQIKEIIEDCNDGDWAVYERLFDESASWAISRIINDKEGTSCVRGYDACGNTDQEEYLGVEPIYPWRATEGDLRLKTENDAIEFLSKYATALGITEVPADFTAHYFG